MSLYALKVLAADGSGYYSDFIAALDWCIANGIRIVNYSAGGYDGWGTMKEACDRARAAGVTVVAAAGNDGGPLLYPAAYASVLSVGSTALLGGVGVVVMWVGTRQILAGTLTVGGLFTYTVLLGFLVAPVFQIVGIGTQMTEALAGLERTKEVFSETPEDVDPRRTVALWPPIRGEVVFDDVRFPYAEGKEVLHGDSFRAEPGTVTALVGPSGSGKSTEIYERFEHVIVVHSVRRVSDLAYREELTAKLADDPLVAENAATQFTYIPTVTREEFPNRLRITTMIRDGSLFAHGVPGPASLSAESDRAMMCGSMDMIKDLSAIFEEKGFVEGSNAQPGHYVIERAFVG